MFDFKAMGEAMEAMQRLDMLMERIAITLDVLVEEQKVSNLIAAMIAANDGDGALSTLRQRDRAAIAIVADTHTMVVDD